MILKLGRWTILFATLSLLACDSSSDGGGEGEESESSAGGGAAAGPTMAMIDIPQVGLRIEAPSEATVRDGIGGNGAMIQARGLVLIVKEPGQFNAATLEAAQADAQDYSPEDVQTETLADGWALMFNNTGSMGANYFVQVRREIGGRAIWCETTAPDQRLANAALEACKSLTE